MNLVFEQFILAAGMLITGSINTISKKAQNDCEAPGKPFNDETESNHVFDHPWFQTIIMFLGETMCIVGLLVKRYKSRSLDMEEIVPGLTTAVNNNDRAIQSPPIFQFILLVPTICDLLGTSISGIGLIYVDASVWQMLRGSIIIFTGLFSKIFLKRVLKPFKWFGILVTMIGLVLVGLSSVLKADHSAHSKSEAVLGITLVIASQLVSASQMVIEEFFLKRRHLEPLHVVGMEGLFGVASMALVILPIMYFIPSPSTIGGRYEDSVDAIYQIGNSSKLIILCSLYLVSIAFYNFFGLSVTSRFTAVHRTMLDACRTLLVWTINLFIYYAIDHTFGEAWDNSYGMLQVAGFLFLTTGTLVYYEVIDLSWVPGFAGCYGSSRSDIIVGDDEVNETTPIIGDDSYARNAMMNNTIEF